MIKKEKLSIKWAVFEPGWSLNIRLSGETNFTPKWKNGGLKVLLYRYKTGQIKILFKATGMRLETGSVHI